MKALSVLALLTLVACSDFASPAELEGPQILAVQSQPASLSLGDSANLTILMADPEGPVVSPEVVWTVLGPDGQSATSARFGIIDTNGMYTAPTESEVMPLLVTVEARIEHNEETLVAIKVMLVGGPTLVNPEITAITVDNTVASVLSMTPLSSALLSITTTVPLSEDATYAWYARPGSIDEYQSASATIVAEEPAEGWLYVVVRDRGGTGYFSIPSSVTQ